MHPRTIWSRRRSRRRGLAVWLALGAALLAAGVGATFVALLGSMGDLQAASSAQQVAGRESTAAGSAEKDLLDMETALRGFLLTRESRFLVPYYAGRGQFLKDTSVLAAVQRSDDGAEDPSTVQIRQQGLDFERSYAQPLIKRATERPLTRLELRDTTAAGKLRVDALRLQFQRQTAINSGDAQRRQSSAAAAAGSTRHYAIAGLVAMVFMIALFALALRRGIALPLGRLRGAAERLTRGDRVSNTPSSRVRELDDLGCSFDSMARALTSGREALQDQNHSLEARVRERTRDLETARLEILARLARAAEFRDDATHQHTERVARTAQLLGGVLALTADETDLLALAAPLHDIGKIGIPDAVLLKPGKLTGDEFALMKTHSQLGADMLVGSASPVLQMATQIALHHHERWDGTGYPHGLRGDQIPLVARIVAVADVLDALTHDRPYKAAWSLQDALHEITDQSARQFDPVVVDALHQLDHGQLLPPVAVAQTVPTT